MLCAVALGNLRHKKGKFFFRVWLLAVPSGEVPSGDMSWAKTSLFKRTAIFVIRISKIRGKTLDPWNNRVV